MSLQKKLEDRQFAVLAEIEPPKGVDVSKMIAGAIKVRNKVDAFLIPEMGNAVMRISSLSGALLLKNNNLEPIMQICCRDRNRLALQADLLGAYASGIANVMVVKGEDPSFGDHHQARPVYDIKVTELLDAMQSHMNGKDMAGIELAGNPQYFIGSTVNAGAKEKDLETELVDMNQKTEKGTNFFILPPLFDISGIEPFLKRVDRKKVHLIPTVVLLKSVGMARYMQRNMDHVYIPQTLIQRIQKSEDKPRECLRIAADMINALKKEGFSGVLISTIGWEHKIPEILSAADLTVS